jgi:hypothetical protein
MTKKLTGKQAADYLNSLHLQQITDKKSEIGFYSGDAGEAIIYLTYYSSDDQAAVYLKQMTDKISTGITPFIMGDYLDFEGYKIYRIFGMGQTHFVFLHKNVLIWLSAGTTWATNFLSEYLAVCRTI